MSMFSENDINKLRQMSCLEMSDETQEDFDDCYDYQSRFLDDLKEKDLYNIRISMSGVTGASVKASNILININGHYTLDIAEGITLAIELAATEKELAIKSVLAAIFFIRTVKKLSTIRLKRSHVFFLIALKSSEEPILLDGSDRFLQMLNDSVSKYGNSAEFFDVERANTVYNELRDMRVVDVSDNKIILQEKISIGD